MKRPIRKESRARSEALRKRAALQDAVGVTGTELKRDFLVGRGGNKREISGQLRGIKVDEHGLPQILTESYGTVLDCGHTAYSPSDVQGQCYRGHTICVNGCFLYGCVICGERLCDREVVWEDDEPVCPEHSREILKMKVSMTASGLIINTVRTLFGIDSDE